MTKKKSRKVPSWEKQQGMMVVVREAEVAHENAKYDFLEKCDWKYTNDNHACIWGWEKKLPDGRVVFAPCDFAMRIQENLDEG